MKNNIATKRVLLLNAGHNDERLLRALKTLDCYVITTGNRPELPGHKLADEYIYGDYTDLDAMYALAVDRRVDAVCPCCNDFGVITAAYISETLGFSGQDNYETTLTIHNKANFKAFAASTVFVFHELRVFFRGFLNHEIVDQTQLTLAAVAARAQNFINYLGIQCNLLCVPCPNRCFNGADLLFHGRQTGQRKSRGNFFLCFAQILFGCVSG